MLHEWLKPNLEGHCPVNEHRRLWLEKMFLWLVETFGEDDIINRRVMVSRPDDFPVDFDGSFKSLEDTMKIIATQMQVDPSKIKLHVHSKDDESVPFFREARDEYSGGLYWHDEATGTYNISVEENNLDQADVLIATLAHEIAHIKLLGEKRIDKNNEFLTDLTTVVFGLGAFNANVAFELNTTARYTAWSNRGYLTQMDWGYTLALFAFLRMEEKPAWSDYLGVTIHADFQRSLAFIRKNPNAVLNESDPHPQLPTDDPARIKTDEEIMDNYDEGAPREAELVRNELKKQKLQWAPLAEDFVELFADSVVVCGMHTDNNDAFYLSDKAFVAIKPYDFYDQEFLDQGLLIVAVLNQNMGHYAYAVGELPSNDYADNDLGEAFDLGNGACVNVIRPCATRNSVIEFFKKIEPGGNLIVELLGNHLFIFSKATAHRRELTLALNIYKILLSEKWV